MNREQAETLLAQLVFDELEEPARSELLAYLKTDPELSEQLGDMRLAAGLLREGLAVGEQLRLSEPRRAELLRQASDPSAEQVYSRRPHVLASFRWGLAAAACLAIMAGVVAMFLPSLGAARRTARQMQTNTQLRGIHQGMAFYAQKNSDRYPNDLGVLLEENYVAPEYIISPRDDTRVPGDFNTFTPQQKKQWAHEHGSYVALSLGEEDDLDTDRIAAFERFGDHKNGVAVVFKDNHVEYMLNDEAREAIEAQTGQKVEDLTVAFQNAGRTSGSGFSADDRVYTSKRSAVRETDEGTVDWSANSYESIEQEQSQPNLPLARADSRESKAPSSSDAGQSAADATEPVQWGMPMALKPPGGDTWFDGHGQSARNHGLGDANSTSLETGVAGELIAPQGSKPTSFGFDSELGDDAKQKSQWSYAGGKRVRSLLEVAPKENPDTSASMSSITPESGRATTGSASGPVAQRGAVDELYLYFDPQVAGQVVTHADVDGESGGPSGGAAANKQFRGSVGWNDNHVGFETDHVLDTGYSNGVFNDASGRQFRSGGGGGGSKLAPNATSPSQTEQFRVEALARNAEQQRTYPKDWPQLTERRLADLDETGGESEANRRADLKLRDPVPISFEANKLVNVFDYLRNTTGVNFFVNWPALEAAGVHPDTPITLQLDNVPAEQALRLVLTQVGDDANPTTYSVIDGIVTISTQRDLQKPPDRRVYDIRDLAQVPDLTDDKIVNLIRDSIGEQTEWAEHGGALSSVSEVNGELMVKTTPANHRQIMALLAVLRKQVPTPDQVEAQSTPPQRVAPPVNPWVMTQQDRHSIFALDVDTASYAIAGRHIRDGSLPPEHTVRMEEFVNAFDYNYSTGRDSARPFAVHAEAGPAPFGGDLTLLKIGVRGRVIGRDQMKPAHLVFVIDVSGSMDKPDRLPLVRQALSLLLEKLNDHDRVSLVTYDTQARLLLEQVAASEKQQILDAIKSLQTRGSTNLVGGLNVGYEVAQRGFMAGGVNRVILCSNGVANVGSTDSEQILNDVAESRGHGISFTSIGFGTGTYDDTLLEQLANKGDGSYVFVGSTDELRQRFVEDMAATLPMIARDAKIQVEFNPQRVRRYRLIGYENRDIADADFRNDQVDAGEVGSGQSATALYELELLENADNGRAGDLGSVFVRYENVETGQVDEVTRRLDCGLIRIRTPEDDPRFYLAAAAAEFAEILRGSEHVQATDGRASGPGGNFEQVRRVLVEVCNALPLDGRARELLELTERAEGLPRAP